MTPLTDEQRTNAILGMLSEAELKLGLDVASDTRYDVRAKRIIEHAESNFGLPVRLYKLAYFIIRNPIVLGGAIG